MEAKETKLNGYTLPEEVKKKMKDKLYETRQIKKEMSFTLCSNLDNIIIARGDRVGDSHKTKVDPEACGKDEKFLGGYHTHPREGSHASAEDLRYCGIFKIICTGGQTDNKIRCHTWKYEQPSVNEYNEMIYDIDKGITRSKNPNYQPSFDCIRDIGPLFSNEKYIKEKIDKDMDKMKSYLSILKKSVSIETQNKLTAAIEARDVHVNKLNEKIKNESKKYYNEVEIE